MKKLAILAGLILLLTMVFPITVAASGPITIDDSGWDPIGTGDWNSTTKTATLTTDLTESIRILGNNITLDGAGHTITSSGGGMGVYIPMGTWQGNTIKNLNVTGFYNGIRIESAIDPLYASNHRLENNNLTGNSYGIHVLFANNNTIIGNTANSNLQDGIRFSSTNNNIVSGNDANENRNGIRIDHDSSSSGNTFNGNTTNSNSLSGIDLGGSSNILTGHTASQNDVGIFVHGKYPSSIGNHRVENNILTGNDYGIRVMYATNNTLNGNIATTNTWYGIHVTYNSNDNIFNSNIANLNGAGITISASSGNAFNGNTTNSNGKIGINLGGSSHTLTGHTANQNGESGICVGSSGHILTGNTANENGYDGIFLRHASNNTINDNTVSFNTKSGIYLQNGCNNNTITGNNVTDNGYWTYGRWGIALSNSTGNMIYYNNIIDNAAQARDNQPSSNDWHESTLLEGNYWSDYVGVDDGSAGRVAGDGIGDTLIPHPAADFDNYPFTNQNGWIAPSNQPPIAADDAYSVDEDNTLTVSAQGVLSNDTDADVDSLTAVKDSDPANGLVTVNSDGSFTYTPNTNYNGADSFTYHANDGTSDSNVATVSITVNWVNDPPVALADSASTDEDTAVTVSVLDNDSDIDGGALVVEAVTQPASGSTTNNGGSVTYDPSGQLETLAAGQTATETFDYTVSDGLGGTDTATVTVTIDGVNDAPVAVIGAIADATIPLPVTMKVTPQTLNLSRLGNWVKVHITDDTENTPQVMEVTLDGSSSYDIDDGDEIVSWDWTLIDLDGEITITDEDVTTVNLPTGSYTVNLVVNDGDTDSIAVSETFILTNQTIDDLAAGSYTLNDVPNSEVKGPDDGSIVISFADDAVAATSEVGPDQEMLLAGTASGVDYIDVIDGGKDGSKGKSGPKFK